MIVAKSKLRFHPAWLSVLGLIILISHAACNVNAGALKESYKSASTDSVVTDIDGNVYHTVTIGSQIWMVENLKVTRYLDGSAIEYISDDTAWSVSTTGAYCWYDDDSTAYKETYGALYNFYAVIDSRGLCPDGWHVPTKEEWSALEAYLGGQNVAGGKLKEVGTTHWANANVGATDENGFCGLPGGGRGQITGCGEAGNYATWWSSTAHDSAYAWHYGLSYDKVSVRRNPGHKASGFSVRCIKDQPSKAK